jgi:hypothetical protein
MYHSRPNLGKAYDEPSHIVVSKRLHNSTWRTGQIIQFVTVPNSTFKQGMQNKPTTPFLPGTYQSLRAHLKQGLEPDDIWTIRKHWVILSPTALLWHQKFFKKGYMKSRKDSNIGGLHKMPATNEITDRTRKERKRKEKNVSKSPRTRRAAAPGTAADP